MDRSFARSADRPGRRNGRPDRRIGLLVRLAALGLAVLTMLAACSPGSEASGPAGVVRDALNKLAAKDVEGLRGLACAGQEDQIRSLLDLSGAAGGLIPGLSGGSPGASPGELLPGVDTQALLDAVKVDVSGVDVGDAAIDGAVARVPLSGDVKVTFDADTLRPIVKQVLEQQGSTVSDTQLDAMLQLLQSYGQNVPLDVSVRLIQEDGAWKICQDALPASSGLSTS
jgi:hypothetical protein